MQRGRLNQYFSDADFIEPISDFTAVNLRAGRLTAINLAPFTQPGTLIIAIPETPVEHLGKPGLQRCRIFRSVCSIAHGIRCLSVALCRAFHIFSAPSPPLYLENANPGINDLIHEFNGAEVFRRHDIFIVDIQFRPCLQVGHLVAAAAQLIACPSVGRSPVSLQAQVAFPGNGHA